MSQRIVAGVLAALMLVAAGWLLAEAPRLPPPIATGRPAPDFSLASLDDGAPVTLSSLAGRVVLLNFWATWCKPCEEEMPAMERLYKSLQGEPFELLAVSVDDEAATVQAFQERLGLSFPILLDPEKHASEEYQSFRFPESYLIDREGILVARYIGPREWDAPEYRERIRRLLAGEG